MNFTKLMPPSPNKIVSSFTTVLPNSNLHLMKKPFHASFFNYSAVFQLTLNLIAYSLMYFYNSIEKNIVVTKKEEEKRTYWTILKNRSKIISLFVTNNTPVFIKLIYIVEYMSATLAINAIFYKEPSVSSLSDYILLTLPRVCYGFAINVLVHIPIDRLVKAFEEEGDIEIAKKKIKRFFLLTSIYMGLSLYFCAVFSSVFQHFDVGLLVYTCQGYLITFVNCFIMSGVWLVFDKVYDKYVKVRHNKVE